jgi:hypothetical protein
VGPALEVTELVGHPALPDDLGDGGVGVGAEHGVGDEVAAPGTVDQGPEALVDRPPVSPADPGQVGGGAPAAGGGQDRARHVEALLVAVEHDDAFSRAC